MRRGISKILVIMIILGLSVSVQAVTQNNNEVSLDSAIYNIKETLRAVETMKHKGTIDQDILKELASQITVLERAVTVSGKSASNDVVRVVELAENSIKGLEGEGAVKADAAIIAIKQSLGIKSEQAEVKVSNKDAAVNLPDIQKHWGKEYISYLVNKGAIAGYPDGTFKPDQTISKAEFVKIAVSSAQNGKFTVADKGEHWASGVFRDAQTKFILRRNEMPESEWNEPINRYEMAMVMVRITENILKENAVSTSGVANIMADYQEVSKHSEYQYYVEQAYMKGLITGMDKQGTFGGSKTGTRAEAATMVTRMLEQSKREKVDTSKVVTAPTGTVLKQTDGNRPLPKAGDTFVRKDGSQVVLKLHEGTGVLGYGQNVSLYEGMKYPNGNTVKHGTLGTDALGYPGQTYLVDSRTGSGFFRNDWLKIKSYEMQEAFKIKNPKEGQIVGQWTQYLRGANGKCYWVWIGPSNN